MLVLGLVFRQIVTLLVAVMITVIWAIPLSGAATWLQRYRVPRTLGALAGLLVVAAAITGVFMVVIPPFVEQINRFVEAMPAIVADLSALVRETTGASSAEVGQRVQEFLRRYIEQPQRLLGPLATFGAGLASLIGALVLMTMTAYFIAIRPAPLLEAVVRLVPPRSRERALHVMGRLRTAWMGWLRGVVADMVITGTLLYFGLRLVGLEFAVVFAVLSAVLVVVPYFGAAVGGLAAVLFALTESPAQALLVLVVYTAVQQVESNVVIPLVMSRTVRLHPAAIAIGVVIVGSVVGFAGLFVAVPIISAVVILTEELWIRPMEGAPPDPQLKLPLGGDGDQQPEGSEATA